MGHIISIASQKGGVGKTTTALNLGVAFSARQYRTLIIDADPQGGVVFSLDRGRQHYNAGDQHKGLYHALCGEAEINDIARPTEFDNLFIVDCGIANSVIDVQAFEEATRASGLLREIIQNSIQYFDLILIDCPPGVGLITNGALIASDYVIIPLQSEPLSLRTLPQLLRQLIEIKKTSNHAIEIAGILITMFDTLNPVSKTVTEQVHTYFNDDLVFQSLIPRDPQLHRLYSGSMSVSELIREIESTSIGLQAYDELAEEIEEKFLRK